MAGRLESLDAKRTCLESAFDDLEPVPLDEFPVTGDVIRMGVRREQVRDLEAFALDCLVQRLERRAAVDEDGRPARPVSEQIGVREPLGVHAPFDQHDRTVTKPKGSARSRPLISCRGRVPRAHGPIRRLATAGIVTSAPPGSAGGSGGCTIGRSGSAGTTTSTGGSGNGGRWVVTTGTIGAWETGGTAGTRAGAGAPSSIPRVALVASRGGGLRASTLDDFDGRKLRLRPRVRGAGLRRCALDLAFDDDHGAHFLAHGSLRGADDRCREMTTHRLRDYEWRMPGRLPLRLGNRYVRHDADARGDDTRGGDSRHTRTGEPGGKPVGETEEPVRDRDEPADASRPGPELCAQLLAGAEEQHLHGRNGHVELSVRSRCTRTRRSSRSRNTFRWFSANVASAALISSVWARHGGSADGRLSSRSGSSRGRRSAVRKRRRRTFSAIARSHARGRSGLEPRRTAL